jgi:hypothetical protein
MNWWKRLLHRRQMDEDLDKELRFHMDQYADDLIANGHDREQARRQARLALGGPEQLKEDCRDARGTRWVEDFLHDLRYALRTLRQRPGFAAVALLTLALGTGATTVMFTVINSVLLKPLPYPEPEHVVTLHAETQQYGEIWGISWPDFRDLHRDNHSFQYLAAWRYGSGTISAPGDPAYVDGRRISSELFAAFGVRTERGRAFQPDEDAPGGAPVMIVSHGLWERRFGGRAAAIGQRLVLDGVPYTIVGVAPADFQLGGKVDFYIPLGQDTDRRMNNRGATMLRVVARLRPGVGVAQAQA